MEERNNKRQGLKGYWHWMLFILFWLLVFPYILNKLILTESYWAIVGGPKEWLAFWPSYLSALASAVMIAYTAMTLKNNKGQLDELKRQWEEEHKPNVSVSFCQLGKVAYLRIVNTSIVEVRNLQIKGKFFVGEEESKFFNMEILERFKIDIEPNGIRNVVLHNNIEPLTDNFYFILKLFYDGLEKPKVVKVYCNNVYIVGDVIQGSQLIESIKESSR